MTKRTPDLRLKEANSSTWTFPEFTIEFAKLVSNPRDKETKIHNILARYEKRIYPNREFFNVSLDEVKDLFDLIDGEWWDTKDIPRQSAESDIKDIPRQSAESDTKDSHKSPKGTRDHKRVFKDGQRIIHKIGEDKIWIGHWNSAENGIYYNGKLFKGVSGANPSPLNEFAKKHYEEEGDPKAKKFNAWGVCQYDNNGKWETTKNLWAYD